MNNSSKNLKLGFVGLGNMGKAIAQGLPSDVQKYFFDPYANGYPEIQKLNSLSDLESVADTLLICVKPDQVEKIVRELSQAKPIISIAAGTTVNQLRNWAKPNTEIVRTMPNLPLLRGEGVVGYFGDESLYPRVQSIFSPVGLCIPLKSEHLLDAITGLSGSGPAFVFSFIQALAEGGVKSGLGYSEALEISIQTVLGSAKYLREELKLSPDTAHPMLLRNRVTSAGGTTISGLVAWEKNAVHSGIMEAVWEATLRSRELGK
jgi:pyrroline-5-carboxylate reductase